jgi:diguanylate cyclase (GGDEF)-like protein
MAPSDKPPAPKTNGYAVLDPPARRPPALSVAQDPPRKTPILIVIHTKDARLLGRRFVLDRSPVLVGRSAENDIVLQDASVSPRHAHLEECEGAWWCVDDGSTDGLYIDDRRTTGRAPLAHGTRIGIGSTIFKFLSGSGLEAQYHEEIYELTVRDGLTQVYNERYLVEALGKEIMRAERLGRPLALLMIEADDLDAIDASNGPNARDHVLKEVADLLRPSVPRDGVLARHGDERFVIVLGERTLEMARTVAESLREAIASSSLVVGPRELRVTVSIGGTQRSSDDRASADLLGRASRVLHLAKSRGPNQLECMAVEEGRNSGPGA